MALYKPTNLSPSNSIIDMNSINRFSWSSQGAVQSGYRVKIYRNSDDVLLYDSGSVTSTDEYLDLPAIPTTAIDNDEECKWTVTITSGVISIVSDYEFFKTQTSPTASFSDPTFVGSTPLEITSQNYTFVLNYSQIEDISIKSYQFILYEDDGTTIVDDSGEIYGFTPSYEFEGMVNGVTYKIKGIVTSQDDLDGNTGLKEFYINYTLPDSPPEISVVANDDNSGIEVSWGNLKKVLGVISGGTSSYITGELNWGLQLESSTLLDYSETFNNTDYTFTYWLQLQFGKDGDFMIFNTDKKIGYDSATSTFYYDDSGVIKYSELITLYSWLDFAVLGSTWDDYSSDTFATMSLPSTSYMNLWLFIGVTAEWVVIKSNNEIVGSINLTEEEFIDHAYTYFITSDIKYFKDSDYKYLIEP